MIEDLISLRDDFKNMYLETGDEYFKGKYQAYDNAIDVIEGQIV